MNFERLLYIVGDEPLFETGLLLAGETNVGRVRRQLSRWVQAGKIYRLRRPKSKDERQSEHAGRTYHRRHSTNRCPSGHGH